MDASEEPRRQDPQAQEEAATEGTGVKNKGGRPRKRKLKQRYKRPLTTTRKEHRNRKRAAKAMYNDPEYRQRNLETLAKARAARKGPPRLGTPDGWTRETAEMQRVYDGIRADLLIDRMKAAGMIDETQPGDFETVTVKNGDRTSEVRVPKTEAGMAQAALREVAIGALSPLTHAKEKLAYNRTLLEWTKAKPAQTSNVNVNTEDWLDAALKENSERYDTDEDEGAPSAP